MDSIIYKIMWKSAALIQVRMIIAEEINQCARFLGCQFIIASHSPFILGTLQAKIYNLESKEVEEAEWYELKNVQFFMNSLIKTENIL